MRVSQTGNNQIQGADTTGVSGAKQAQRTKTAEAAQKAAAAAGAVATEGAARTEISGRAKELAKAKELANAAPDVREERVAALKAKIAAGKYKVDADAVADRMVDEHLKAGIG
ncbi:MAG: flagellar biosynthesis anti-sigma factor FlgM [Oligoflexia bacterium]|nr:flagellar biosynthesis anti-sigma factor FlgM [Oligoflexia bacterium]